MNPSPSPAVLAANERLYALRDAKSADGRRPAFAGHPLSADGHAPTSVDRSLLAALPGHLGWGSAPLTAVLRRPPPPAAGTRWLGGLARAAESMAPATASAQAPGAALAASAWVKIYPDIGLGMLRREQAAAGRIWLLLRALDADGRGWVAVAAARTALATNGAALRVCGWRQLRNLLQQGQDIFWRRDRSRIWLRSAARVAAALEVAQLTGRPVALPVRALLGSIGTVRAHLYASFHGGRVPENVRNEREKPIARATLARLSGVTPESLRAYERRAGVRVRSHFAVAEPATAARGQERAWQRGRALFAMQDFGGRQGARGTVYLAWQLPNSYVSEYRQRPRGQQKRINRRLEDLLMKGMAGNDSQVPAKRYFRNGAQAAKAFNRQSGQVVYWRQLGLDGRAGGIWRVLGN